MLDRSLTPYVEGGIGWTYIDSNIIDGIPSTGCWWDPWWGPVCATFPTTYGKNVWSFALGAGLRAELTDTFFLRGGYEYSRTANPTRRVLEEAITRKLTSSTGRPSVGGYPKTAW